MIVFLPESPYVPVAGTVNAAVLNQCLMLPPLSWIGSPIVVGAQGAIGSARDIGGIAQHPRRERRTGGDGKAALQQPTAEHLLGNGGPGEPLASFAPGQLQHPVAGQFVALIKAGKPTFGPQILIVLRHHLRAAADR